MRSGYLLPLLGVAALGADSARAEDWDMMEGRFGATHVTAQAGNGGLTAGVAPRGEITVLSWPSPSFYDQVEYETSNDDDARQQPFFGAEADQGIFAGLYVEREGAEPLMTWLRDPAWQVEQRYLDKSSGAVLTQHVDPDLGLSVAQIVFVDQEADVLSWRTLIKRHESSQVTAVRVLIHENLAPAAERPVDLSTSPVVNPSLLDDDNDFAAFWDPGAQAVVHFAPPEDGRDLALLDGLMNGGPWAAADGWQDEGLPEIRGLLEAEFAGGVVLAIGGAEPPDALQVGWQDDLPCDRVASWTWAPGSAFLDAADGQLGGSPLAACHADAALAWDRDFGPPGSTAETWVDVFIAAGPDRFAVSEALAWARLEGLDPALDRNEAAWAERALGWREPDGFDDEVLAFARRTLIALLQGTDRDSGAMVASIAVQPSYHHDWPRDSVFFDLALDLAGEWQQVGTHKLFVTGIQNRDPFWGGTEDAPFIKSPPGAWFMNYYADGEPSTTFLNAFEIDQVGLALWGFWAHAALAPNDRARRDAMASAWPAMRLGASLLSSCVDPAHPALAGTEVEAGHPHWWPVWEALEQGEVPDPEARRAAMEAGQWESLRPCEASEDDNPLPSVSLYSTHTARMGLLSAVRAARLLCLDDDPMVQYWKQRADELAAVAFKLYYDEAQGSWTGRTDWVLWPMPLQIDASLDELFSDASTPGERRLEVEAWETAALDALAASEHEQVADATSLATDGAAYVNKKTLSLARWWTGDRAPDDGRATENAEHVRRLAVDLPIPGTRHVGEVWVSVDDDGDGVFDRADQRVSTPHLWAATLTWLSAMAIAHPELFSALESDDVPRLCTTGEEPLTFQDAGSCGDDCQDSLAGERRGGAAGLLALLVLLATARRCRR